MAPQTYFTGELKQANALTNWDLHPYPPLSIHHAYPTLPLATTCPLTVSQNLQQIRDASFFYKRLKEE